MSIKTEFTIKDLENLSGVKAHTIRIWEKRYGLLTPVRSNTNIRSYDIEQLQKLLNVETLIKTGNKISKVAEFTDAELIENVQMVANTYQAFQESINGFLVKMLKFDRIGFERIYSQLQDKYQFDEIFIQVFLPLLDRVGILWMTKAITPVHEHFISVFIQQKLLFEIENTSVVEAIKSKTFVLFLPFGEIHELGLLFIHWNLLKSGNTSIYLGPNVPTENLKDLTSLFSDIHFVSYFTVSPAVNDVPDFVNNFNKRVLIGTNNLLSLLGKNVHGFETDSPKVNRYLDFHSFLKSVSVE